jgi:gliding motility-associated-like protein
VISGANSSSYTTTNTTTAAGIYYVTVSTTCNVVSSESSIVYVTPRPQGRLSGSTIQAGSTGQLTYTSSNGAGPFTIVYQANGGVPVTISNVTSGVPFSVNTGTPTSTTTYTLVSVTDEVTTSSRTTGFTTSTSTITVIPKVTAVLSVGTPNICDKATATLNVVLSGTGPITVTLNDGTVKTFAAGTTTGTISVTPATTTTYSIASVIDSYGTGNASGSATVTVYTPATITVQPVSTVTIIEGTTTTLSVTATGQPSLTYQWYQNGTAITGATSSAYTTTSTLAANGDYYVTVTTACNVVSSSASKVIMYARPQGSLSGNTIQTGSTGQLTYTSSNGSGTFTIVYLPNGGTPVTVTNVTSGVPFAVATGTPMATRSYTLVSVTDEVTTSSRTTGFTGATATITVFAKPTAVLSGDQTICDKATATLNVVLTGNGPVTVTLNDGTVKTFAAGTTNGTISVTPATNTIYSIASISDTYGTGVVTGTATVLVYAPAVITVQPVSVAVICAGSSTTLDVTATGAGITYQWYNKKTGIIAGETNRTYVATAAGDYYVIVTGTCNAVSSAETSVTVNQLPQGTLAANTICVGATGQLTFKSSVAGTGPYTIVYSDGTTSYTASRVVSAVPFDVLVSPIATTTYSIVSVTDASGCIRDAGFTAPTAVLTVNDLPAITSQPVSVTNSAGTATTFEVAATGTALTYQWQISVDGGISFVDLLNNVYYAGATTNKLSVSNIALRMNGFRYRVRVSGTCNPYVISDAAILTVINPLASFKVNTSAQCISGNSFVFTNTSATNVGILSYSWTFGDGIGTATTKAPSYTYTKAGTYTVKLVVVTNTGDADSATAQVVVYPKPVPAFAVNKTAQCLSGNSFVFTNGTTIDNSPLIFDHKWNFGDGTLSSDINPIKTYTASGDFVVTLVETSFYGCVDSVKRTITVNPMPTVTISAPKGTILCDGLTLDLTATGGASYLWYKDGVLINAANAATYASTTAGNYSVKSVSSFGCVSLSDAKITTTVLTNPKADFSYNTYCTQVPVTFTNLSITSNAGAVTYAWRDNVGNTSAATSPVFTYNNAGSVSMKLNVTSTYCPNLKDSITKVIAIESPIPGKRLPLVDGVIGDETKLQARIYPNSKYTWSPATGLSDITINNPITKLSAEQQYSISMLAPSGCTTVDTLLVRVFKDFTVFVPNVFSPNGDGQNDKLYVNLVGVKEFRLFRIFNRAGQKVFETTNPAEGWDGTVNGIAQPLDTYVWMVEAVSKYGAPIRENGLVTILR